MPIYVAVTRVGESRLTVGGISKALINDIVAFQDAEEYDNMRDALEGDGETLKAMSSPEVAYYKGRKFWVYEGQVMDEYEDLSDAHYKHDYEDRQTP